MRISELSRTSGVPIPSVKFYLRENLLQPGEATRSNQARYGDDHVKRLKLIRALIDIGGLSVASARVVLEVVDAPDLPLGHVFGTAQTVISQSELYSRPPSRSARDRVDSVIAAQGWNVSDDNPGRIGAANVIDSFTAMGHPELIDLINDYAGAAETVARADLAAVGRQPDVAAMAVTVVAGTVLGDAIFAALRRIAQEHVTFELYPDAGAGGADNDRVHEAVGGGPTGRSEP